MAPPKMTKPNTAPRAVKGTWIAMAALPLPVCDALDPEPLLDPEGEPEPDEPEAEPVCVALDPEVEV